MIIRSINKIKEQPAGHENKKNPGSLKKIIFDRKNLPGLYKPQMINWARIPSGRKFRPHYHQDMTEIFIILKGRAGITVDGKFARLKKGDAVLIEEMKEHVMENTGKQDVEYLVIGLSRGEGGKTVISGQKNNE